jgi:hypothetical protein
MALLALLARVKETVPAEPDDCGVGVSEVAAVAEGPLSPTTVPEPAAAAGASGAAFVGAAVREPAPAAAPKITSEHE